MLVARFAPMIFVLAPGRLAGADSRPCRSASAPCETHKPLFAGLLVGVIIILVGLTYFPALALGPFAEGLH